MIKDCIKDAILSTRVTKDFLELVDEAAEKAGMKRGAFLEEACKYAMAPKIVAVDMARPGSDMTVQLTHIVPGGVEDVRVIPATAEKHRTMVLDRIRNHGPATKFEIAKAFGWSDLSVSPRLTELKKMQLIVAVDKRKNPDSGATCSVWGFKP